MAVFLRALRALFPLLHLRFWVFSVLIIFGVLTALSEGLSISLFIPLVQGQLGEGSVGFVGRLSALFQGIPADRRIFWVGASVLVCVVLENVLSYGYSLVSYWINASISHRLRSGIFSSCSGGPGLSGRSRLWQIAQHSGHRHLARHRRVRSFSQHPSSTCVSR